ncbi:hypothetical protein BUALT_Bualt02G0114500 [Buddleja alternifolia]|uniref:Late embryogenesis abundant protein LEA-2 subgroup domain-containing protein n=1 Tax=Buddleja alternifolia TaxID=168488 RepID=A0AAV6YA74_9LAMI|nr:hypothetical protein BUALT_Bualt02G0114500 [Buddleja alternifolia]
MTAAKHSKTSSSRQPLLREPEPPQYVVVLPPYPNRHRYRQSLSFRLICSATAVLFLLAAAYLLWPSDPELSIARLSLDRLHFHARPKISLDVALDLTIKVRNKDFYSIDYDSLLVGIAYKGEELGFMTSDGGRIKARGSSYVNAALNLDGVEILSDVILLLEDLVRGEITFDTVSEISGKIGLFFFDIPIKAKVSCEVIVNTRNQTITRQSCYPKV